MMSESEGYIWKNPTASIDDDIKNIIKRWSLSVYCYCTNTILAHVFCSMHCLSNYVQWAMVVNDASVC